jgi:hypothetical protein
MPWLGLMTCVYTVARQRVCGHPLDPAAKGSCPWTPLGTQLPQTPPTGPLPRYGLALLAQESASLRVNPTPLCCVELTSW